MPARNIMIGFDKSPTVMIETPLSDGRYLSQHSDKEYETLLKAFCKLGEDYDRLKSERDELKADYDEMLEDELEQLLREESEW